MKKTKKISTTIIGMIILMFAAVSCGQLDNLQGTVGVTNDTDDLSIAYANMNDESEVKTYNYTCTTDSNSLSIGGALNSGILKVEIKDDSGNIIYKESLTAVSGNAIDLSAPAGIWSVKIELMNVSGSFGINLEKNQ